MDKQEQDATQSKARMGAETWPLKPLLEFCDSLYSAENLEQLTGTLVNKLSQLFCANKVSCMLLDENTRELSFNASQGVDPSVVHSKVKLGESFCGRVAQEGKPLLVKDVEEEYPDLPRGRLSRYQTKSFVIMPLKSRQRVLGVVSLTDRKDARSFSDDDLEVLRFISNTAAGQIENIKLIEKSKGLAIIDPLSELYNHRYFHEQLIEEIYRAERYRRPLSALMIDIDNFSAYNEAHGYSAGDSVLRQIGVLLKENVRQVDAVCRYGLDEFAIILPETKMKEGLFVAEKIRERIGSSVFTEKENRASSLGMTRLTVSVGIAEHNLGLSKEEFIRHVSAALLEAQQKGKNCVCVFK